jgi:hypothetical protein
MKGLLVSILLTVGLILSPCLAASDYRKLSFVSGSNPNLELFIHKDDLELNLAKKSTMRLQLKVSALYITGTESKSFQIVVYDINNNSREFVSSEAITIDPESKGTRTIEVEAGRFSSSSKSIQVDILNTEGTLINTYSGTLTALNTSSQTTSPSSIATTCNGQSSFIDCMDVFFQRTTFEAIPQKKVQTRVVKDTLVDTYKVKVPLTSLKGIDSLQIDPRSTPPTDASLGAFYVDDSEAICVYVNNTWVKLAGAGICQ